MQQLLVPAVFMNLAPNVSLDNTITIFLNSSFQALFVKKKKKSASQSHENITMSAVTCLSSIINKAGTRHLWQKNQYKKE